MLFLLQSEACDLCEIHCCEHEVQRVLFNRSPAGGLPSVRASSWGCESIGIPSAFSVLTVHFIIDKEAENTFADVLNQESISMPLAWAAVQNKRKTENSGSRAPTLLFSVSIGEVEDFWVMAIDWFFNAFCQRWTIWEHKACLHFTAVWQAGWGGEKNSSPVDKERNQGKSAV